MVALLDFCPQNGTVEGLIWNRFAPTPETKLWRPPKWALWSRIKATNIRNNCADHRWLVARWDYSCNENERKSWLMMQNDDCRVIAEWSQLCHVKRAIIIKFFQKLNESLIASMSWGAQFEDYCLAGYNAVGMGVAAGSYTLVRCRFVSTQVTGREYCGGWSGWIAVRRPTSTTRATDRRHV